MAADRVSRVVVEVLDTLNKPEWPPENPLEWIRRRGYDPIAGTERKNRLAELAAYLIAFSLNLARYEQGEYEWGVVETSGIETLLRDLELACTVCSPLYVMICFVFSLLTVIVI